MDIGLGLLVTVFLAALLAAGGNLPRWFWRARIIIFLSLPVVIYALYVFGRM